MEDFIIGEIGESAQAYASNGFHTVEFTAYEMVPENVEKDYKAGIGFVFKVVTGKDTGKIASNIGPMRPTKANISGKIMLGMGVKAGENLKDFVGKKYQIVVDNNKAGGRQFKAFTPQSNVNETPKPQTLYLRLRRFYLTTL